MRLRRPGLRKVRDLLLDGHSVRAPEYGELQFRYGASLRELQRRMRAELGTTRIELSGGS